MPEGKKKFVADAARVARGRADALRREIRQCEKNGKPVYPGDRAAAREADHIARMIETLAQSPYRGDPYEAARKRVFAAKPES
ncbi:hypothetical protein VWX96_17055 [Phaeobacter sp. A90a-4f]|uniref:hypothetical protein n=1 Tax=unclassified Phaeobacter TaxID=2621772 RepID=UPI003A86A454